MEASRDEGEQRCQMVVVAGGVGGEGVAVLGSPRDVVAHPFAQAIVVIARIVDGEQPAVFGVQHEQQPVQKDQRRVADFRQVSRRLPGEGGHKPREHGVEHDVREVARDLLLVAAPLSERGFQKGGLRPIPQVEGIPAEQQVERAEGVFVAGSQQGRQVGLVVAAGARPGAGVIQPPNAAVGQDAPAQAPVGDAIGGRQVSADLPVGGARPGLVGCVTSIEGQAEPLALFNQQSVPVAFFGVAAAGGAGLGFGVSEQQMVGDVFVARGALLRQVVDPAEQRQDRADQVLLGDRFVGAVVAAERLEALRHGVGKLAEGLRALD